MQQIITAIIKAFRNGNKLLICGNGGSAAAAQHFAAEFVGRYKYERRALPAIALTTDTSILTAIANDYGFENVFSRQVEALGRPGDILITLSTSGKSINCIKAAEVARKRRLIVFELDRLGEDTPSIQENHLWTLHRICEKVEKAFI